MMRTILKNKEKDLILIDTYSSSAFYYAWICGMLAFFLGLPFILILRGGDLPARLARSPRLVATLFNRASAIVPVSAYLDKVFGKSFKVTSIPNTIKIADYPYFPRRRFNLGCFGRDPFTLYTIPNWQSG